MMEAPIAKLPKSYYKYLEKERDFDCKKKDTIAVSFTTYQACKLEKFAAQKQKPVSDLFKKILVEEGVLSKADVKISGRQKHKDSFEKVENCDDLKGTGGTKLYKITLDECTKAKIVRAMAKEGVDLSFWLKTKMVQRKAKAKKWYHIFDIEDLSY